MLEFLQTGKALSVLAAIGVIGIISKLITRSLYKRLLKETDNMAMTKNKNLKALKQKLENVYRLNQNIINTQAYLDKQMYNFKFMKMSLETWNNISMQMTILLLMAGGAGSFLSYWYRLDSYYIVLYAAMGVLGGLFLVFLDSSFHIAGKQQRLETVLLEYVDNSAFLRAARENSAREGGVRESSVREGVREAGIRESSIREGVREAGSREAGLRSKGVREGGVRESSARQEELCENTALGTMREAEANRERILRENEIRDGLVHQEATGRQARGLRSRSARAEELLRTVREMKEEKQSEGRNAPERNEKRAMEEEPVRARDSEARRDIDYLKRSLEQIAASRDKGNGGEKGAEARDWTKNMKEEELKVIGEFMKQYFSGT